MTEPSSIAKPFGISALRLNLIPAEIGWIKRHIKVWEITNSCKDLDGIELEIAKMMHIYVACPGSILTNRLVIAVMESMTEELADDDALQKENRKEDGYWVRSRAEIIIDDALYDYGIPHAYKRCLPVEEEIYSDLNLLFALRR